MQTAVLLFSFQIKLVSLKMTKYKLLKSVGLTYKIELVIPKTLM